jgi:hypothetical protein
MDSYIIEYLQVKRDTSFDITSIENTLNTKTLWRFYIENKDY